jgi:hypothetical protein
MSDLNPNESEWMKLIHPTTENSVPGDIKYEDLKDLC